MGRDKATLDVDGESLWRRQTRVLQTAGAAVVGVVRQHGQPALELPLEIRLWHEAVIGVGLLAGLQAALAACEHEWLAVLAVDMPCIDPEWSCWLRAHCRAGRGAIAQRADQSFEPLAAIHPRTALAGVEHRLHAGPRSLQSLADILVAQCSLTSVPLPTAEPWRVANWNTRAEVICELKSAGFGPGGHAESSSQR
jgi:molybdopterin-guanine dinucleotide biosynthesis protein A